jgi:glycosyltransferase involved in cell wall biosynthesis
LESRALRLHSRAQRGRHDRRAALAHPRGAQDYTREYEVVVFDDGSTDATAEVLEPYRRVLPLTLLRSATRRGTAAAMDALCRHVAGHTRYPRRDAAVFMQGDFTDRPEDLPELAKRFEGGADLIVGRRPSAPEQPLHERRLRTLAPWVLRPFVRADGVEDLVTGFRLVRVSVLRDLTRARGRRRSPTGAGGRRWWTSRWRWCRTRVGSRWWTFRGATTCARATPGSTGGATCGCWRATPGAPAGGG